jgi:hypothetical protein
MIDKLKEIPGINFIIPTDPQLVVERDASGNPIRYSLDANTEKYMQRQRLFAMVIGGPTVVYAGFKADVPWWQKTGIMALGVACTMSHYYAYQTVREAEKQ